MRQLFGGGSLAWAMALALLLSGCGEDEEPSPTETQASPASVRPTQTVNASRSPTGAPTGAAEAGGEDGFRAFAAQVDHALAGSDGSFFADRGLEEDLVCTGDEQLGPCAGQAAGTAFRGIPRGIFQSDAFFLTSPEEYADDLVEWLGTAQPDVEDDYGDGAAALYALAHQPASGGREEAYQTIITGIVTSGADSIRQARILSFRFVDDRWRLTGEIEANMPQTAEAFLSGECDDCYDRWERWEGS